MKAERLQNHCTKIPQAGIAPKTNSYFLQKIHQLKGQSGLQHGLVRCQAGKSELADQASSLSKPARGLESERYSQCLHRQPSKVVQSNTLLIHFGVHKRNGMMIARPTPPHTLRIICATNTPMMRSP